MPLKAELWRTLLKSPCHAGAFLLRSPWLPALTLCESLHFERIHDEFLPMELLQVTAYSPMSALAKTGNTMWSVGAAASPVHDGSQQLYVATLWDL